MSTGIAIHNLAVLRAAVEGVHLGTYFGSWGALTNWIESTRRLGLVDSDDKPTELGAKLAAELELSSQGGGRAYGWRHATALEERARSFASA